MIFFITIYSILALEEPHIKYYLVEASKSGQANISLLNL